MTYDAAWSYTDCLVKALRPRQNGGRFPDDIYNRIWTEMYKCRINNIPIFVQIMAWRDPDHKPLSEPIIVSLLTHICVTQPQCVRYDISSGWLMSITCRLMSSGRLSWRCCLIRENYGKFIMSPTHNLKSSPWLQVFKIFGTHGGHSAFL